MRKTKKIWHSFHDEMKKQFSCRVYKVCVDGGFTCPNRDGSKGYGGCIFCDEKGSSSRTNRFRTTIKKQVLTNLIIRKSRYRAKKFIIYFQSFSNTYAPVKTLKKKYDEALYLHSDILGLSVATRADCVDEEKIRMIAEYKKHFPYINIEYGMQTKHNKTLHLINRKETHEDLIKAIELTQKYALDWTAHIIVGLPGEDNQAILETVEELVLLKAKGVKIHMLVAMKKTLLANWYKKGKWQPLKYEQYINIVANIIERLPSHMIIHRLSGNGHPLHIEAPTWIYDAKKQTVKDIENELIRRNTYQSIYCKNF